MEPVRLRRPPTVTIRLDPEKPWRWGAAGVCRVKSPRSTTARRVILRAMNEIILRTAEPDEAGVLTALTRRSKGHWGYPQAMLDRMAEMLSVSSATIRDGVVVVAERLGTVLNGLAQESPSARTARPGEARTAGNSRGFSASSA